MPVATRQATHQEKAASRGRFALAPPKIDVEFAGKKTAEGTTLYCQVYNRQVASKFLAWMGVRRKTATVNTVLKLTNDETGQEIFGTFHPRRSDGNEEPVKEMDLTAGELPIPIAIVIADRHGPRAYDRDGVVHRLPVGTYRVDLDAWAGEKHHPGGKRFVVTSNPCVVYWIDD